MSTVSVMNRCEKCGHMLEEIEIPDDAVWESSTKTGKGGAIIEVKTTTFTVYCPNCANPMRVKCERCYNADGVMISEDIEFLDD